MTYNHRQIFAKLETILSSTPRCRLKDLAQTLNLDRHTIEKAVRESTGTTFRQYQNHMVLERCLSLLTQECDLNGKQVARQVGYGSTSSFSRFVKRRTGQTPTCIRKKPSIYPPVP